MRAPFQVLIFPYWWSSEIPEVLIGCRAKEGFWQGFSGGGEGDEAVLEAAIRELKEETNVDGIEWQQLDSMCTLPKIHYNDHTNWNNNPYVIPEYAFSVLIDAEAEIVISEEHSEVKWCTEDEAIELLKYDSNKNAVWELFRRLESLA